MKNKVMNIHKLRQRAGLSVPALAAETGVYPGMINNWEHEVYLPTARQLPVLAMALGCSIDALYVCDEDGKQVRHGEYSDVMAGRNRIEAQRMRVRFGEDERGNGRAAGLIRRGESGRREDDGEG